MRLMSLVSAQRAAWLIVRVAIGTSRFSSSSGLQEEAAIWTVGEVEVKTGAEACLHQAAARPHIMRGQYLRKA